MIITTRIANNNDQFTKADRYNADLTLTTISEVYKYKILHLGKC